MLNRLKQLLKLNQTDPQKLEVVIDELSAGTETIKGQIQKISRQESEILEKLNNYTRQHEYAIERAKKAFLDKNKTAAESIFSEGKILKQQISQYRRIAEEIRKTKQKLLNQEGQFCYTKDKLIARQTLGEANVDSSQISAEISEHLMFLSESKELERFDELIEEASFKSQAIKEIQSGEETFESFLSESNPAEESLEKVIAKDKEGKLLEAHKQFQNTVNRFFGEVHTTESSIQKENQQVLLNRLKKEKREEDVKEFFTNPDQESQKQNHVNENKDRVKSFFESAKPASGSTTDGSKDLINQFFNSKR